MILLRFRNSFYSNAMERTMVHQNDTRFVIRFCHCYCLRKHFENVVDIANLDPSQNSPSVQRMKENSFRHDNTI